MSNYQNQSNNVEA